jgi:hypothetical protein
MGQIIKPNFELPYKSLIFNYRNVDIYDILYDDTNSSWLILNQGTGILEIRNTDGLLLDQTKYCVIVTPMKIGNNHSISVLVKNNVSPDIILYCCENGNNNLTDDGFEQMSVEIKFFDL